MVNKNFQMCIDKNSHNALFSFGTMVLNKEAKHLEKKTKSEFLYHIKRVEALIEFQLEILLSIMSYALHSSHSREERHLQNQVHLLLQP
jgi:hypothetical protein